MDIYVMRHGTTIWNEKGITQGRTNNNLSKDGISLTKKVALDYKDTDFDIIFCSPLRRTVQTANIMNTYHNKKVIKDDRLIEIDQGIFTGRSKFDLTEEEQKLKNTRAPEANMESYQNALNRSKSFIEYLRTLTYKSVLIITHNCNATFLEDIICLVDVDFSNPKHLRNFKNAEIKKFTLN